MVWKWVRNIFGADEAEGAPDNDAGAKASKHKSSTLGSSERLEALEDKLLAPLNQELEALERSPSRRFDPSLPDLLFDDHGENGMTTALDELSSQDPSAAIRTLRRYQRECPDHIQLLWRLGRLYASRKERGAARQILQHLTKVPQHAADAHQLIAELYEEEGEPGEAVLHYQRALAWDWGRPGLLDHCRRLAAYLPAAAPPPPLRIIAHQPPPGFRIEHPLGRGGFGTVYLARDQVLDRPVAMKFLHHHHSRQSQKVEQLFSEARVVSRLAHSGVVGVYELDRERHLLIMEYMTHGTLADRLAAGRPLHPVAALSCARQVCSTLADVHEAGLIHRDLKPANVLFRREGEAVLGDFGIAELEGKEQHRGAGTQLYAAPECAGEVVDRRADLYSIGLLIAEMLTAIRPPQDAGERARWLERAARTMPDPLCAPFLGWLTELTAVTPSHRPGSAKEVEHVLANVVTGLRRKHVTTGV